MYGNDCRNFLKLKFCQKHYKKLLPKNEHYRIVGKKVLHVNEAGKSCKNLIMKKDGIKVTVRKLEDKIAGKGTVKCLLWEMECLEIFVVRLSYKKTARNGDKMSMSKSQPKSLFASKFWVKTVPEIFFQEGAHRDVSSKYLVETVPENFY